MPESETSNQSDQHPAQRDEGEKQLKYLNFVQCAVIYFVVCLAAVYQYLKENAGSFKPRVQTVEDKVKTVVLPLYEKYQDVPSAVLMFADDKVGDVLIELDRHVPAVMKQVPDKAMYVAHNLPEVAKDLASEGLKTASKVAHTLYVKYEPTAKQIYVNYEPVAEKYAVSTWKSANKLPLFPQVAQIAVPTTAYVIEKYNVIVCYSAEKGYQVAQFLPLVPLDKIAKVFEEGEKGPTVEQSTPVETS